MYLTNYIANCREIFCSVLTTADGTAVSCVFRQVGRKRVPVKAPLAVPRYNKTMQAVDRVDQLMRLFALTKTHKLKKWYRQFMLSLIDMAIVNADIHYHLKNPEEKKKKASVQIYGTAW